MRDSDLQEEQSLCDLLDEFLRDVLGEELGPELELQRVLLLDVLGRHLRSEGADVWVLQGRDAGLLLCVLDACSLTVSPN